MVQPRSEQLERVSGATRRQKNVVGEVSIHDPYLLSVALS